MKKNKFYILCPAYLKTGGTELLHQLAHKMMLFGKNVFIVYCNTKKNNINYQPTDFLKYGVKICDYKDIEDSKENTIIYPETFVYKINRFKNINKIIWWLSVDNFSKNYGIKGICSSIKKIGFLRTVKVICKGRIVYSKRKVMKAQLHLCQSYYAIDYLKNFNIDKDKIFFVSDYINSTYFVSNQIINKENIVLYNPKKGLEFTNKIKEKCDWISWIAIQNLTTEQVKDLLLKSKVYIDFGNHPGKDRFPREAAMCNCCVITGKKGSAAFYEDVPIPNEFKFEDTEDNIKDIIEKINECILNYDEEIQKFNYYREFIKKEEKSFEADIKNFLEVFER